MDGSVLGPLLANNLSDEDVTNKLKVIRELLLAEAGPPSTLPQADPSAWPSLPQGNPSQPTAPQTPEDLAALKGKGKSKGKGSKGECWNCGKMGHSQRWCRAPGGGAAGGGKGMKGKGKGTGKGFGKGKGKVTK